MRGAHSMSGGTPGSSGQVRPAGASSISHHKIVTDGRLYPPLGEASSDPRLVANRPTCCHVTSSSCTAWVISTKPSSPTGLGARAPPMILGATKAMTCGYMVGARCEKGVRALMKSKEHRAKYTAPLKALETGNAAHCVRWCWLTQGP